jgi:TRAP-type C4-dicarboxylate transport system permease small subunit
MANLELPPEASAHPAPQAGETGAPALRIAATVLRTLFIGVLLVLTLRVSLPQNETIWTAYDTPADLVRLILGVGVCAWLVYQLFQLPRDGDSSRTWFYLGLVAVPFALIVLFVAW